MIMADPSAPVLDRGDADSRCRPSTGKSPVFDAGHRDETDTAVILFTSGTTGQPRVPS